MNFTCSKSSLS